MPAKSLITEKNVRKQLLKLPLKVHQRILNALRQIQQNPNIGPKLQGELEDYHKFRVGDYRLVYKFDSDQSLVTVVKIEHRQGVYK